MCWKLPIQWHMRSSYTFRLFFTFPCYAGCFRSQWFIILVFAHIWSARELILPATLNEWNTENIFSFSLLRPGLISAQMEVTVQKKDVLNELNLLGLSLWVECVMPACLPFLVRAFLSVQWHTCPANLWIWHIVYGTWMWTFWAFKDWVHYRFPGSLLLPFLPHFPQWKRKVYDTSNSHP